MSLVTENQPDGTPTWIDLAIPDLERAMGFYGALFGWEFQVGVPETMHYTQCLLGGRRVAALAQNPDPAATAFWWNVYLATADCDVTAKRVTDTGGSIEMAPTDIPGQGRMAIARDPVGAQSGLWEGRGHVGCEVVNEPGSLVRNDLVTPDPEPARAFYAAVFDFTLDVNQDLPGFDFTFLRRPDGHEIGGIMGIEGRRPRPGRPPSRSPTPTPPWPGPPRPAAAPVRPRTSSTAAWPPSPTPSAPSSR
jgi:predicted enzyme related to lactoylglutathione lyase